jgi:hypothetical protein
MIAGAFAQVKIADILKYQNKFNIRSNLFMLCFTKIVFWKAQFNFVPKFVFPTIFNSTKLQNHYSSLAHSVIQGIKWVSFLKSSTINFVSIDTSFFYHFKKFQVSHIKSVNAFASFYFFTRCRSALRWSGLSWTPHPGLVEHCLSLSLRFLGSVFKSSTSQDSICTRLEARKNRLGMFISNIFSRLSSSSKIWNQFQN